MRNGLAVAGIAGGLWFLGNAVANAADGTQTADCTAGISQDAGGTGTDATNHNNGDATCDATNVDVNAVKSVNVGGDATNDATVNTGQLSGGLLIPIGGGNEQGLTPNTPLGPADGDNHGSTTLNGGDVNATQNAAGGNVLDSGNVAVKDGGTQTATATAGIQQNANGTDDGKATNHNNGNADADAKNVDVNKVTTVNKGGDASNEAWINTGLIGNFYCAPHATCTINGGNVTLVQNAQGGNVVGSGNVGINAPVPVAKPAVQPAAKPAVKPAPRQAHPVVKTVVLSSAQPKAVLATTGAEFGLPLTAGLIALAAGTGLTLAGRRRQTASV